MVDPYTVVFVCSSRSDVVRAQNQVNHQLPMKMRKPFGKIFSNYLARFGLDGVYERMNGRTVGQIIAEYEPGEPPVIVSGECDGMRFTLYAPPNSQANEVCGNEAE